jgi:SulP family sulfate permease
LKIGTAAARQPAEQRGDGHVSKRKGRRSGLASDAIAGIPGAVGSVPDGMAAAVLAGVNPIHGLYASVAGPTVGGLTTGTRLMVITTTSAAALAAGSAVSGYSAEDRPRALFLLTIIAGLLMAGAGLAGLGRYARFVSHSVMTGFLTGIATNIALGQLAGFTGTDPDGDFAIVRAFDVLAHPAQLQLASLATGAAALSILVLAGRTRLRAYGALIALAVPAAALALAGVDTVAQVSDTGDIPLGLPMPALPDLGLLSPGLILGALAVAAIVLVQGVGVGESVPNPSGRPVEVNRDFMAQGFANVASGFFRGVPVGGSVGQTALNVSVGARSRWASVMSGVWMILILVAFAGVVGRVPMPTLAAVLIFAAVGSIRPREIATIFRTGREAQIAIVCTFLATLFLPVAAAVGIGVALSLLLQLNREAMDLAVVQLVPQPDGRFVERPAPERLGAGVTVLDVYGSLLYAGARTLQARLPSAVGAEQPVVVLRLRGRTSLGATFLLVMADYARLLESTGGRLYLSGVDPELIDRFRNSRRVRVDGPVRLVEATEVVGASTTEAVHRAQTWLISHAPADEAPTAQPGRAGGRDDGSS